MRQSVESSRNRNNLRQRRQDDGGKKTQTNHVWLCSNICSLDKPSNCGLGAHPRAGIIFCSATSCTFHCTWGSARLGRFLLKTSQPSSTRGYRVPSLRDCFATVGCMWDGSVGCNRGQNLDVLARHHRCITPSRATAKSAKISTVFVFPGSGTVRIDRLAPILSSRSEAIETMVQLPRKRLRQSFDIGACHFPELFQRLKRFLLSQRSFSTFAWNGP